MAKIAILGLGTVGSGVAEVLETNAASIAQKAGEPIEVKYVLGRHAYPDSPYGHLVVQDFSVIEHDPEVSVVAECMGGTGDARDYTLRALRAGKSVVTSNKEVVAQFGDEFMALAEEKNVNYLYEAAVGGGIPILRPLGTCLASNEISEIYGILNGTTNYILTKMIKEGLSFDTALQQAQEKGYAEADPTADVEGFDACRKICILAALAFGRHVYPEDVPTQGITGITSEDVALAEANHMKIKLLGRALRGGDGRVVCYVAPHLIPEENLLSGVDDVFNSIMVRGNAVGDVLFYGRGAGKLPTASAVTADVVDAVKHREYRQKLDWAPGGKDVVGDYTRLPQCWCVRSGESRESLLAALGQGTVVQTPGLSAQTALITGPMDKKTLDEKLCGISVLSCLPVLA